MAEPILRARDITVTFAGGQRPAVAEASLDIRAGDAIGIVGESGSGKTTLARALVGALAPSSGSVEVLGRPWSSVEHGDPIRRKVQMIFQDPYASLNPRMTARQTVGEVLRMWNGWSRHEARERAAERLAEVGIVGPAVDRRPTGLSGGQCQRVGIARALACDPEILIADEPTSSLDVSVQANILNMLMEFRESRGLALVFISHDLSVVRYITNRAFVMYRGRVIETGATSRLLSEPSHPYTLCLIDSIPGAGGAPQIVRNDLRSDKGCVFAARCTRIGDRCDEVEPELGEVGGGHTVACHYPLTIRPAAERSG
jgi:oligopeptide/dipeptide ABC transporter ATP-binding protein